MFNRAILALLWIPCDRQVPPFNNCFHLCSLALAASGNTLIDLHLAITASVSEEPRKPLMLRIVGAYE